MKTYKIESILLATDFSQVSHSAVTTAIAICKRQNSKLTLIHAVERASLNGDQNKSLSDVQLKYKNDLAERELGTWAKKLSTEYQLQSTSILSTGAPAEVICNYAANGRFSMIVMGTHGHSSVKKQMGSVAFGVVRNAPCPVLVVPGDWDHQNFSKIVYPIRMDQRIFEKFNYITPIVEKNNSELIIAGLANKDNPDHISETVFSIELLRNMCQDERIIYSTVILPCNIFSEKVLETAAKFNADLIVISPHLDYDAKEHFVESFAKDILDNSKYPVLSISPLMKHEVHIKE